MPNESLLFRSLSAMDAPQRQPVVAMYNLTTAFRRDRSPNRLQGRRPSATTTTTATAGAADASAAATVEPARHAISLADHAAFSLRMSTTTESGGGGGQRSSTDSVQRAAAVDGSYYTRTVPVDSVVDDGRTIRRSQRASFDENSARCSSRLQVADVIPHVCGRQRSSTMSQRSPVEVRQDRFTLNTVVE